MKQLELTEAEKAQAPRLAKQATAVPSDDFWNGVSAEAERLSKVKREPEIKPRQVRSGS